MAYTEFFVTKGSAVANTNGGGPNLGTNDGPVYTTVDSTVAGGALTTVIDNSGSNWAGVQVDDWICWDTAGTKEFSRVSALAPGGDATKITIATAVTAAANKTTNVGGAWATIQFGADAITTAFVNAAGDPPCLNVKYDATAYDEEVVWDTNTGSTTVHLTFEGYETTPHDRPATNRPKVLYTGAATSSAGLFRVAVGIDNVWIISFDLDTNAAADQSGIKTGAYYGVYVNNKIVADGSGASYGIVCDRQGSAVIGNYIVVSTSNGIYLGSYELAMGNVVQDSGATGIRAGGPGCTVLFNVINNPTTSGVLASDIYTTVIGNTIYSSGGDGIDIRYRSGVRCINNVMEDVTGWGINASLYGSAFIDFNAYEACSSGEVVTGYKSLRPNDILDASISGSVFTTAGSDFSLNATAGRGALLRAAGFPGSLIDGTNIGYLDIGALQHQDAGGAGAGGAQIFGGFVIR